MRTLSIGRSLRLVLLGLTLALSVIAALGVASLYNARERYEDDLSRAYALEASAARLLAAGVVEEAALQDRGPDAAQARARAQADFDAEAARARDLASGDRESERLVGLRVAAQQRARQAAGRRAARNAPDPFGSALLTARRVNAEIASRQRTRREEARDEAADDSRAAVVTTAIAGGLALLGALALVAALIGAMRRPLADLVRATRGLAAGDLRQRVEPEGPRELRDLGQGFNAMAGDLEAASERLEEERMKLAVTVESLADALVVCDADGTVATVNPRAEELVPELRPGEPAAGPLPSLEEALGREVTVDHGGRTLAITAARLGGAGEGVVWTIRDISERARLERLKSEFVATASHELRSPLTSIKGFVELLAESRLSSRQSEYVEVILASTNRLVDLVNDLLDVARVEAGTIEIHRRPVDVGAVTQEVATLLGPRLADKSQELDLEIAPAAPPAYADPQRLRQILTNLLTNAHLYTDEGGRLSVAVRPEDGAVRVSVTDSGRGMTSEELEHAFDRFYRGEDGGRNLPGTGLGLSIVKSLVDLHRGSIDVESSPGEGTTFTVRLPKVPESREPAPRLAIRGKRVLVVEDEPEVGDLIAAQLEPFGVETALVGSGDEALELLRRERFDAITLDILMPGAGGFEVLRAIRSDPELRRTPIVVVSVLSGRPELAGEWTVAKPIDAVELADALGSAVLAGRTRVLVVGRASARDRLEPILDRMGLDHEWVTSGAAAARACGESRFEVALVDAGMRSPPAALRALDLRGRRLGRAVVLFSTGDDSPGVAALDTRPVPVENAAAAVLNALGSGAAGYASAPEAGVAGDIA